LGTPPKKQRGVVSVTKRFDAAIPERAGVLRIYIRVSDKIIWAARPEEFLQRRVLCEPDSWRERTDWRQP
jgi:hypothetical protein